MTASAPQTDPISRLNNPARTYRSRRFANALTNANAQLTAVVDRYSFNVGLFHSLLCDGSSRRTMTRGHRDPLGLRCRALSSRRLPGKFVAAVGEKPMAIDKGRLQRAKQPPSLRQHRSQRNHHHTTDPPPAFAFATSPSRFIPAHSVPSSAGVRARGRRPRAGTLRPAKAGWRGRGQRLGVAVQSSAGRPAVGILTGRARPVVVSAVRAWSTRSAGWRRWKRSRSWAALNSPCPDYVHPLDCAAGA